MPVMLTRNQTGPQPDFPEPSRRTFLRTGLALGGGIVIGDLPRYAALAERSNEPRAQAIIHIFLPGGIAHQESFDPKPEAPIAYRGDAEAISTKLPGIPFTKYLKKTGQILDRITLCRAVTHLLADHTAGVNLLWTGYGPSPVVQYPSVGSVVSHKLGSRNDLPPYICIPDRPNQSAGSGYLNSAFGPFTTGSDPLKPDFQVRDLAPSSSVDERRLARARRILESVNRDLEGRSKDEVLQSIDAFYAQAWKMITSPAARKAFDLKSESDQTRSAYGPQGLRMLAARRLVEAGVRFVALQYGTWDDHFNITPSIREKLPPFDQAFAALITDLDERGLLDNTLVAVTTEFGRTPKVNSNRGRDHWSRVFSVLLAGGGLRRGYVHGASSPTAEEPQDAAITPQDLLATIYRLAGIDASRELMTPGGRPIEIVKNGSVIDEILA